MDRSREPGKIPGLIHTVTSWPIELEESVRVLYLAIQVGTSGWITLHAVRLVYSSCGQSRMHTWPCKAYMREAPI